MRITEVFGTTWRHKRKVMSCQVASVDSAQDQNVRDWARSGSPRLDSNKPMTVLVFICILFVSLSSLSEHNPEMTVDSQFDPGVG